MGKPLSPGHFLKGAGKGYAPLFRGKKTKLCKKGQRRGKDVAAEHGSPLEPGLARPFWFGAVEDLTASHTVALITCVTLAFHLLILSSLCKSWLRGWSERWA